MRLMIIILLSLLLPPQLTMAQDDNDRALFEVNDVVADVTAANAAAARDQAIMQAQRDALGQLLTRLGADTALAAKQNDDQLARLVQGFEVQQERTSAVRYIGTFTVQFKPQAVRALLSGAGGTVTLARGKPEVILPVVISNNRAILWEDTTPWRKAWEDAAQRGGLIPLIVPPGDIDVIALINGQEALAGKPDALAAIMSKYQVENLAVATWREPAQPTGPVQLELTRFTPEGGNGTPVQLSLNASPTAITDGVKALQRELEKDWRSANQTQTSSPIVTLPVTVPAQNLASWTSMVLLLTEVKPVRRTNIIALSRGHANIELEYAGDLPSLQSALLQKGLMLQQAQNGGWLLRHQ